MAQEFDEPYLGGRKVKIEETQSTISYR